MKYFALISLLAIPSFSQVNTDTAETKGACSPANTGDNNTFNITCGIGKQQGDALLKIINKIVASQLDPNMVMAKLDEILMNQKKQGETITQIQSRSWKRLSDSEVDAGAQSLALFRGQKVSIVVANQDPDRMAVAEQLAKIFVRARWDWRGIETPMRWGDPKAPVPHGLILHVGEVSDAADVLGRVLISLYGRENVPDGWKDDAFAKDLIQINIQYKQ